MRSAPYIVICEPTHVSVAQVAPGGEVRTEEVVLEAVSAAAAEDPAPAVKEALAKLGYRGGVCLGVSSAQTLVATIDCGGIPRKDRRRAMLFRLEEHLPIDAEDFTADFLTAAGGLALGVAVETAPLACLIDQLAEAGVETAAIAPTALLALWESVRTHKADAEYVLLASREHIDIFRMADGRPHAWHTAAPDATDVVSAIKGELLSHPSRSDAPAACVIGAIAQETVADIERGTGLACQVAPEQSVVELAARAAACLLDGQDAGWVDLRRDALAVANPLGRLATPLKAALVLTIVTLIAVSAAAWWRATRYDDLAGRMAALQAGVYHRAFPNSQAPPNVRSRLQSEVKRLEGLRGTAGAIPDQPSAFDAFSQVVAGVPEALRLRIVDIRIDPTGIQIEGQARSHADAEKLSQAIRASGRYVLDPPRTEQLVKGGIGFTLTGRPATKADEKPAAKVDAKIAKGAKP